MSNDMPEATITKAGEIHFPTWVKLVGSAFALALPLAVMGGIWVGSNIFEMSVRMARIEASLLVATEDRYRESQARDAHSALNAKIQNNADDIQELQKLHGRAN